MIARRFLIRGLVQGVGYRYFAVRAAERHGIAGYVRNLPDGRVEVVAEGEPAAMEAFKRELERGPAYARVTAVEETTLTPTGRFRRFEVAF
ncbi:MAG: acylphosphatase [Acidobacteria bacterium]|nr:MAG: acylphosphatase [Acidobacteriota bacterium]